MKVSFIKTVSNTLDAEDWYYKTTPKASERDCVKMLFVLKKELNSDIEHIYHHCNKNENVSYGLIRVNSKEAIHDFEMDMGGINE